MERIISQLHQEAEYHFPGKSINVTVSNWKHVFLGVAKDIEVSYTVSIITGDIPDEVIVFYNYRGDNPHKAFMNWCYEQKESRHYGESKPASSVPVGTN